MNFPTTAATGVTLIGFEADGIQRYIMQRNTLRQMVGASAIVEALGAVGPGSPICTCLTQLNITPQAWGRSGGGGFTLQVASSTEAERLLATWPLVVDAFAPGLAFVLVSVSISDKTPTLYAAWQQLKAEMRAAKRLPAPQLPLFMLPMVRDARSGEPMISSSHTRAGQRKAQAAVVMQGEVKQDAVAQVLAIEGNYIWPRDMATAEQSQAEGTAPDVALFPHLTHHDQAKTTVGVIHIDGNGFGLLADGLRQLCCDDRGKVLAAEARLSALITTICHTAAKQAVAYVLLHKAQITTLDGVESKVIPARPLILAGEDVSLIVRGDLALAFVQAFLPAFETASVAALAALKGDLAAWPGLPAKLTASAGVALVSANHPFELAHELAEELCKVAKQESKSYGLAVGSGTVAFERVTASMPDAVSGVNFHTLTLDGGKTVQLGRQAYAVEAEGSNTATRTPTLASLRGFVSYLQGNNAAKNAARTLIGHIADEGSSARVKEAFNVTVRKLPGFVGELCKVAPAGGTAKHAANTGLPFTSLGSDEANLRCPLHDALALVAAEQGSDV